MTETTPPTKTDKLDFKLVAPVLVIVLIDLLGLTIIIPLLPLYATSFGANAFTIGLLGAAYPLMQFLGAPWLGRLSDKYGRRPVLIVSQIGTLAGFLILGFANSLPLIFLSRMVDGLSGANIAVAQAVITDRTTEKTRTQGLGLIGAAFGIGFIIGPIIAFVVLAASRNNYALVAFVAAAFSFGSILLTSLWLEESLPLEKRGKSSSLPQMGLASLGQALRRPHVGFLLILIFFQQFAFGGFEQMLALFTLERMGMNASSNAALFAFAGIMIVVVQGVLVGRWSRRFGDRWLVMMGLTVCGLGMVLAAVTPRVPVPWYDKAEITAELNNDPTRAIQIDLPEDDNNGWLGLSWMMLALIPAAVGGGVLHPAINSLLTRQVAAEEAGEILGMSAAFFSAANAITPIVLGAVFQFISSTGPFLISGIILWLLYLLARTRIET